MAHRGYIAKVERDGSGRYIYLGHGSNPIDTDQVLLHHYQEPERIDALLNLGSIPYIEPEPDQIMALLPGRRPNIGQLPTLPFHGRN